MWHLTSKYSNGNVVGSPYLVNQEVLSEASWTGVGVEQYQWGPGWSHPFILSSSAGRPLSSWESPRDCKMAASPLAQCQTSQYKDSGRAKQRRVVPLLEKPALAGVAQWIECWPVNQRVASCIPSLGHMPGLQARSSLKGV